MLLTNQITSPKIALSQDKAQQPGSSPLLATATRLVPIRQQYQLKNANCTRFWQLSYGHPCTDPNAPIS